MRVWCQSSIGFEFTQQHHARVEGLLINQDTGYSGILEDDSAHTGHGHTNKVGVLDVEPCLEPLGRDGRGEPRFRIRLDDPEVVKVGARVGAVEPREQDAHLGPQRAVALAQRQFHVDQIQPRATSSCRVHCWAMRRARREGIVWKPVCVLACLGLTMELISL